MPKVEEERGLGGWWDRGCVAIGVNAVQMPPSGVWLAGLEIGLEQAGEGCLGEEGFGWGPELDLGTGEDGVSTCQQQFSLDSRNGLSFYSSKVIPHIERDRKFVMVTVETNMATGLFLYGRRPSLLSMLPIRHHIQLCLDD